VPAHAIAATLDPLVAAWSQTRQHSEGFGDFCARIGRPGLLALLPSREDEAA